MGRPIMMAEIWRGDVPESLHLGHAVVCDAAGEVRAAWGEPETVILPRSSVKMLQALPLVERDTAGALSEERIALACASHEGAALHVGKVAAWLEDIGLSEADLLCGAALPGDREERHRLRASGEAPSQLHNPCSGKHAGFLVLARERGGVQGYVAPDHPVQAGVRAVVEEMTGVTPAGYGIDGCAAPNFATTVRGLARAMARMADPEGLGPVRAAAARRIVAAMLAHPLLVAGQGRACTELMEAMQGRAAVKMGAEAVYTAILPREGLGVAVKIVDGGLRGAECAIAAILARLGVLEPAHPAAERRLNPKITNLRGQITGRIRPAPGFWEGGRAL